MRKILILSLILLSGCDITYSPDYKKVDSITNWSLTGDQTPELMYNTCILTDPQGNKFIIVRYAERIAITQYPKTP